MTDTVIRLGNFEFGGLEVPQQINFGGKQQIVQHELIGGVRVLDSLGKSDSDISWSGLMTGPDAITRAQTLNQLRVNGETLSLQWFSLNYSVIIASFEANTEKFYQVTYTITLKVLTDNANPISTKNIIGFNEAIRNDLTTANTLSAQVNVPAVTTSMAALTAAVDAVPTFNGASQATTAPVTSLLQSTIDAVKDAYTAVKTRLFGA